MNSLASKTTRRFRTLAALVIWAVGTISNLEARDCDFDRLLAQLAVNDTIVLRLVGPDYRDLTSVQVVQGERRIRVQQDISARLGPYSDGGRDLTISAGGRARTGRFFRIEGRMYGRTRVVLPVQMEVTKSVSSPFLAPPPKRDLLALSADRRRAPLQRRRIRRRDRRQPTVSSFEQDPRLAAGTADAKAFSQPVVNMREYHRVSQRVPADPILELAADDRLRAIVPPVCSIHGYGSGSATPSGEANLVMSVVPQSPAIVGGTVELHSFSLPAPPYDACRMFLDDVELEVIENTQERVVARLPDYPIRGPLKAVRASDNAEAILADEYVVASATVTPRPFDYFDAYAGTHSLKNAYLLALASQAVYVNAPENYCDRLKTQAEAWGLELIECMDEGGTFGGSIGTDTQGFIMENDELVIMSFAGTQSYFTNLLDGLTDFAALLVPAPDGWGMNTEVHYGFLAAHNAGLSDGETVYEKCRERAALAAETGKQVWVTGHSLGGAIASLVAYHLSRVDDLPVQGVVTFGAPAVGDDALALAFENEFGTRAYRWVNYGDPVPFFPWNLTSFAQAGEVVYIDSASTVHPHYEEELSYDWNLAGLNIQHMHYFHLVYEAFMNSSESDEYSLWPEIDP